MKLCRIVPVVVFGLWERFLTAMTRVIVAAPLGKQRDAPLQNSGMQAQAQAEATPTNH
jgi:hypothetical protein